MIPHFCHAPIPGPTKLADRNRVRGVRTYTRTLYLFLFYNRIKISYTYEKNYHWSGAHQNLYTYTESHLQIQNCSLTITNQSVEPTCSEPLLVCWSSCMRCFQMSSSVPTRIKNPCYALRLVGNISYNLYGYTCIYTES